MAAIALSDIGDENPDTQVTIVEVGAIEPLVAMLDVSKSPEYHKASARCLATLARGSPPHQIWEASEGAIPPLVELLKVGNTKVHGNVTLAVWHLAEDADNQLAIARSGGIPSLVLLLTSGSDMTRCSSDRGLLVISASCS